MGLRWNAATKHLSSAGFHIGCMADASMLVLQLLLPPHGLQGLTSLQYCELCPKQQVVGSTQINTQLGWAVQIGTSYKVAHDAMTGH